MLNKSEKGIPFLILSDTNTLMGYIGKRDSQLDAYRGLIMIYIVCVVHVMFWLNFRKEPFLSICLFEMPVIFYISGGSYSLSLNQRNFIEILGNRIKRVILPFLIYALTSTIFFILIQFVFPNDPYSYTLNNFIKLLLTETVPELPFVRHLWFVLPYMVVICLLGFEVRIIENLGGTIFLTICILCFSLSTYLFVSNGLILKEVLLYNIFCLAGYLTYKKPQFISKNRMYFILIFLGSLLILSYVIYERKFCPMQSHKFLPDLVFLAYGIVSLFLIIFIFSKIKIPLLYIVELWNKRGYTIYLYQNVVYFIFIHILSEYRIFNNFILDFLFSSVCIFMISTLLSYLTYPYEKMMIKKIMNNTHIITNKFRRYFISNYEYNK